MTTLTSSPSTHSVTLQQLLESGDRQHSLLQSSLTALLAAADNISEDVSVAHIPFAQFQLDSRHVAAHDVFCLLYTSDAADE